MTVKGLHFDPEKSADPETSLPDGKAGSG